ncbi:MAG: hypothetical protein E7406_08325 [Ruminococcaceae bacterium]|nr:hypothetical protein [Oscillospiraceae bacterium]
MRKRAILIIAAVCVLFAAVVYAAQPGSEDDPLVTKSYLDSLMSQETKFKVVEVPAGRSVICFAGTEMILRMGTCNIIGTQKGGVSDVTMGLDLPDGSAVQGNHLLIVPLDDGRGVRTSTDCLIMIKGGYEIR